MNFFYGLKKYLPYILQSVSSFLSLFLRFFQKRYILLPPPRSIGWRRLQWNILKYIIILFTGAAGPRRNSRRQLSAAGFPVEAPPPFEIEETDEELAFEDSVETLEEPKTDSKKPCPKSEKNS